MSNDFPTSLLRRWNSIVRAREQDLAPDQSSVVDTLRAAPTRRDVLRGLTATGLGLGLPVVPAIADAREKRRKKPKRTKRPKRAKPNQYGCLEVGDPCRRRQQCCSGICAGKRGKKRCRAHGAARCPQKTPGACTAKYNDIPSLKCDARCFCYRTTAGSNFCSQGVYNDKRNCAVCRRDADCVALGFPPGSACAPIPRSGTCAGFCDTGTACLAPCAVDLPAPPEEM